MNSTEKLISLTGKSGLAPVTIYDLAVMLEWLLTESKPHECSDQLITVNALARFFGCGEQRMQTALERAKIEPVLVGKTRKYPKEKTISRVKDYLNFPLTP